MTYFSYAFKYSTVTLNTVALKPTPPATIFFLVKFLKIIHYFLQMSIILNNFCSINSVLLKLIYVTSQLKAKSSDKLYSVMPKSKNITAQKMKLFIKDFFSKCDQICWIIRIWSHLLKKSLMENFIFCAVCYDISNY